MKFYQLYTNHLWLCCSTVNILIYTKAGFLLKMTWIKSKLLINLQKCSTGKTSEKPPQGTQDAPLPDRVGRHVITDVPQSPSDSDL